MAYSLQRRWAGCAVQTPLTMKHSSKPIWFWMIKCWSPSLRSSRTALWMHKCTWKRSIPGSLNRKTLSSASKKISVSRYLNSMKMKCATIASTADTRTFWSCMRLLTVRAIQPSIWAMKRTEKDSRNSCAHVRWGLSYRLVFRMNSLTFLEMQQDRETWQEDGVYE